MVATKKSLFRVAGFLVFLVAISPAFAAGKERMLHTFYDKPSANPGSNLVFDAKGNLYGSTVASGYQQCQCGTIFRLSPRPDGEWNYKVIYQFTGASDGGYPVGNLVFDTAGNLYGASEWGYGGVFKLTQRTDGSWTETTIHTFGEGFDGANPASGLILDRVGSIYGTTRVGGEYGDGTVYELTPATGGAWSEAVLYSFSGTDGANPFAGVTFDRSGNLYGTTGNGGQYGRGVVFQLAPAADTWTETVLHSFTGGTDPGEPFAGVILDSSGSLYGTTTNNDYGEPSGTVFRLNPNVDGSWTETILHTFGEREGDGNFPWSDLVPDALGSLYGTTSDGGTLGYGVIYKLSQDVKGEWTETVFHSFSYRDGAAPANNPVTFNSSGDLFIATSSGGLREGYDGYGVVLELAP